MSGSNNNDEESRLWDDFIQNNCNKARNKLVTQYHTLAKSIAAAVFSRRPDNEVEFGDYLQYASIGLLDAIDRYNPDKGAAFKTYASYRIKGAVLNGVQTATELRSQIQYSKRVKKKRLQSLNENSSGSKSNFFTGLVDLTVGLAIGYMLEGTGLIHEAEELIQNDPYKENVYKELCNKASYVVENLPEKQRMVVQYHYYQHMPFEKIADLMKVSKGRISQIHKNAIINIKRNMFQGENFDSYY